jgi:glycine dehydrogenase subunit 1
MAVRGIVPGLPLGEFFGNMSNCLLVALTEKRTRHEIDHMVDALRGEL